MFSFSSKVLSVVAKEDLVFESDVSKLWIVFSYSSTTCSTASANEFERFSLSTAESPIASVSVGVSPDSLSLALVISEMSFACRWLRAV